MGQTFFFPSPPQFTFLLFTGLGIRRVVDVAALEPKPPNQQRALSKLPTELPTRKFLPISTDLARKSAPKVQKRVRIAYTFRLGFHFACHPWWLGRDSKRKNPSLFLSGGEKKEIASSALVLMPLVVAA